MCAITGVGIALAASGALAAGASVYGANKAASASSSATKAAIGQETNALNSEEALTGPYRNLGQSATSQLSALLGVGSGAGNSKATLAALQQTPGYQFTQQQGDQATLNAATATGMLGSGNTLEALDQYNTGLADQTYQNAVTNAQNAVNTGANAATGTASNIAGTAGTIGNQIVQQGGNIAGLDTNLASSLAGIAGNTANAYTLQNTLAGLQNPGITGVDETTLAGGYPSTFSSGGYTVNAPGANG